MKKVTLQGKTFQVPDYVNSDDFTNVVKIFDNGSINVRTKEGGIFAFYDPAYDKEKKNG